MALRAGRGHILKTTGGISFGAGLPLWLVITDPVVVMESMNLSILND